MPTVHLVIKGKVQGVFYRATAKEMAEKLSLNGWIKNTAEGHVEATIQGSQEQIDQYIAWCWKGPARAKVDAIEINETPEIQLNGFQVVR